MENSAKVKNTSIQEIFQTMKYGDVNENTDKAIEWIRNKENSMFAYIEKVTEAPNGTPVQLANNINEELLCTIHTPEIDTIKNILAKSNQKNTWIEIKALERAKILNKLSEEIEKNAEFLSHIEIVSRGILGKDTRNIVPLLAQYFQYYSSFIVNFNKKNPNWKPEGIVACVIPNESTLLYLGLVLAPALSAGYNIVLQIGTKLCPAVFFIVELAKKVGIPEDVLRIIPSNEGELLPYLSSEDVAVLTLFVDLHREKYLGINSLNKKILILSPHKIPMIVFDDADLDSAAQSIGESAWGYKGLLPWSIGTILVQENILATFLHKLKEKLKSIKIGSADSKIVDISDQNSTKSYNKLIKLAQSQGIEIFQAEKNADSFTPTLFIGATVQTNMVLTANEDQDANIVTVLAFRSIDEAVNLANNTRQGLAASVWSENIGLVNEVTRKLKVSNIWVNSHGLITAEIPLSPIKDSGVGYFGGKDGFYEYVHIKNVKETCTSLEFSQKLNSSVAEAINKAKKSQESWYNLSKTKKIKLLQQFANYLEQNMSTSKYGKWFETWVYEIYERISESYEQSFNSLQAGYNVVSLRDPRGVIVIETKDESMTNFVKLVIFALFEGNSVILLNESDAAQSFFKDLSQKLPSGVLTLMPYNLDNVKSAASNRELNAYFGSGANPVFGCLPLKDSKMFTNITNGNDTDDFYRKVTISKNVWTNIGKSSACNLSNY